MSKFPFTVSHSHVFRPALIFLRLPPAWMQRILMRIRRALEFRFPLVDLPLGGFARRWICALVVGERLGFGVLGCGHLSFSNRHDGRSEFLSEEGCVKIQGRCLHISR